jgi:hypothetical protein
VRRDPGGCGTGKLPFEQQQSLFRHLPLELAAVVVAQFPYYHEYVLLHSLPAGKMRAFNGGGVVSLAYCKAPVFVSVALHSMFLHSRFRRY